MLGRSGSGKTTLLKLINRLREPSGGNVYINGKSAREWDLIQLRRSIGYVIQEVGLFPHRTVAENVCLLPRLEKWAEVKVAQRFEEVMHLIGLSPGEYASRYPRELSGGQRQRIGVARALALDPAILLMDEPFGALDPVTRAEIQREFAALAKRVCKTVVLVTHDVREALLLGSRIALLDDGRLVASATPQEFLRLEHPVARQFLAASELKAGVDA